MKPLKEKVSITLDNDVIDHIKTLADDDGRSFSQYINLVLRGKFMNADKAYSHAFNRISDLCSVLEDQRENEIINVLKMLKDIQAECEEIYIQ